MIQIFSGEWRGLGEADKHHYLKMDFMFRDHLHHFKGAPLAVFMALCLHCDQNGDCFPSYDLIESETGYSRDTVATALEALCKMVINGERVLARYRLRDENNRFVGGNNYKIFPRKQELALIEPQSDFSDSGKTPTSENSDVGKIGLEVKPCFKEEPRVKSAAPLKTQTQQPASRYMSKPHSDAITFMESMTKAGFSKPEAAELVYHFADVARKRTIVEADVLWLNKFRDALVFLVNCGIKTKEDITALYETCKTNPEISWRWRKDPSTVPNLDDFKNTAAAIKDGHLNLKGRTTGSTPAPVVFGKKVWVTIDGVYQEVEVYDEEKGLYYENGGAGRIVDKDGYQRGFDEKRFEALYVTAAS